MVSRGLWKLRINGKWYRQCHPRGRVSAPNDRVALRIVKKVAVSLYGFAEWEAVPSPSPLHSNLDYVYTIDEDNGYLIVSQWNTDDNHTLRPTFVRIELAKLQTTTSLLSEIIHDVASEYFPERSFSGNNTLAKSSIVGQLNICFSPPTPLNELQQRLLMNFIFTWRFHIDDPVTWQYPSSVFNTFAIAFLRLAAWDLEVSSDSQSGQTELPINFKSIPRWKVPERDVYWFHGFLVALVR
ncbi:hypothetical protein F5884DRAFT_750722 [Xylogone sp. PMI_703]|nr:hypothetical protein F5884DRAFT_750722 [Xylogone sp. PMI_703]